MKTHSDHGFLIGCGEAEQHDASAATMGSKAWNLLRMASAGLRVPPAFVLGTHWTDHPDTGIEHAFASGLPALEQAVGRRLGHAANPLIVSVRSGAAVSMPGMMETLLNIGLSDRTLSGFLRQTGNPRLVWDAYRRLVASYGEVVAGLPAALFESELERMAQGRDERSLDFGELRELTRRFLDLYAEGAGKPFPQDPGDQLAEAVRAVFASWNADKAATYRRLNGIAADMGTAVTVQAMVFGNCGHGSGAGVGFTRNPATGEPGLWVDFLSNAQGEDVVSGRRSAHGHEALEQRLPAAWADLQHAAGALESLFGDMQDFEFTVQDGVLHLLQSRTGKRTPRAAARIALDLLDEGVIDADTARHRTAALDDGDLHTMRLVFKGHSEPAEPLAWGMTASAGIASGEIAFDGERVAARVKDGARVILVRSDAETADIGALEHAAGLLTRNGARTSHAAVVARQLGKVCLVGCDALRIDLDKRRLHIGEQRFDEGDAITLDGNSGGIHAGTVRSERVPDRPLMARLQALRGKPAKAHGKNKR
ncbi:PEP-utilizing enzyme [Methyloversatilis sp. XJ19-13]|uniref:PEP/pyruvate-binding domain-containing protein n=1 Tax=Methyloversatilis sp. XJ19-13 TaxID=2963430 RepID=UPI00211B9710|nr:PEP/pyruvate-binding domain-containing protein [Methyloversatilis sp. XJ19-13]MCQ9375679.1 PEP-utilizing enzyme [Methyloversatilis sp. XJ19-13]